MSDQRTELVARIAELERRLKRAHNRAYLQRKRAGFWRHRATDPTLKGRWRQIVSDDLWIIVPNWDKFQHYKDREPVWIKLYLELRDRDDWGDLSYAQRGLLISVWLEFGASRGVLRVSKLAQRCRQRTRIDTLGSLVRAGFLELSASKPLALARSREDIDLEEEKDLKPPLARSTPEQQQADAEKVARMIQSGVLTDPVSLDAEIRGYHLSDTLAEQLRAQLKVPR